MRKGDNENDLHSDYPISLDFNTQNNQNYANPDTTLNNEGLSEDGGNLRHQLDKAQMYSIHIQRPSTPESDEMNRLDNLPEGEVRERLKELLQINAEKERDLTIAAEIGQHLLQANAALKTAYQDLLDYSKKHINMEPTRTADEILRDVLMNVNPFESHDGYGTDDDSVDDETQNQTVQDLQSLGSASTALEGMGDLASPTTLNVASSLELEKVESSDDEIQNVSSPPITLRKSIKRNMRPKSVSSFASHQQYPTDIHEYISSLEYVNTDLNAQLKRNKESDTARIKKLESELEPLRSELQQTLCQLSELEKEKKRLMRERIEFSREQSQLEQTDREIIDELFSRVQIAEEKYELTLLQKKELNKKIDNVFGDLLFLRQRCSDLEKMLYDSEYLRELNIRQSLHIEDLKKLLEEERYYSLQLLTENSEYSGGGFGDFNQLNPPSLSTDIPPTWFQPSPEIEGKTDFFEITNNSPALSSSGFIMDKDKSKYNSLISHQNKPSLSKPQARHLNRSSSRPDINISRAKSPTMDDWLHSPELLYPQHQFWAGPNLNQLSGMGLRSVTNVGIGSIGPLRRPLMPSPLNKTFPDNDAEDTLSIISLDPVDDNVPRRVQFIRQQQQQPADDHHINYTLESDSEVKFGYFSPRTSRSGTPNGQKISVPPEVRRARTLSIGSAGVVADEKILARDGHGVLVDKWFTMCWNLVYKPADSSS
ncbi:hypothetical protein HK096_011076 [Nowakowskiella sp. JEL0078]|nr:hypothetical protein HK096_011076 [Nowakowskiella sp. JEL0078]